jgi:hypothetical protein
MRHGELAGKTYEVRHHLAAYDQSSQARIEGSATET